MAEEMKLQKPVGEWMDGWVGGGKSQFKDYLQQSKINKNVVFIRIQGRPEKVQKQRSRHFLSILARKTGD